MEWCDKKTCRTIYVPLDDVYVPIHLLWVFVAKCSLQRRTVHQTKPVCPLFFGRWTLEHQVGDNNREHIARISSDISTILVTWTHTYTQTIIFVVRHCQFDGFANETRSCYYRNIRHAMCLSEFLWNCCDFPLLSIQWASCIQMVCW